MIKGLQDLMKIPKAFGMFDAGYLAITLRFSTWM